MIFAHHLPLRAALLKNGFTPLPTMGGACPIENWERLVVTEAEVMVWEERYPTSDTAIRLENDLAAVRMCGGDPSIWAAASLLRKVEPSLANALLGTPVHDEIFLLFRVTETFDRVTTRLQLELGDLGPTLTFAEAFGGASGHLVPAFIAATEANKGKMAHWQFPGPHKAAAHDLPVLATERVGEIVEIIDELFATPDRMAFGPNELPRAGKFLGINVEFFWENEGD